MFWQGERLLKGELQGETEDVTRRSESEKLHSLKSLSLHPNGTKRTPVSKKVSRISEILSLSELAPRAGRVDFGARRAFI